jgi:glycine betaine/proline transport system permease protein
LCFLDGVHLFHDFAADRPSILLWPLCATFVLSGAGVAPACVLSAKKQSGNALIRPVLDFMQTMPAFVYLIPAAMLIRLGRVPGILATAIFALAPAVRLANLGIRQVNNEQVEAGCAFGANRLQLLFKGQLPIALPSIMTGVNCSGCLKRRAANRRVSAPV